MSKERHTAIVVSCGMTIEKHLETAHAKATEIFPWVSPISPHAANGVRAFFIPPDGSYQNWTEAREGTARRDRFTQWLGTQSNEELPADEDMSVLDWIEVQYGEHNLDTRVLRDSDAELRQLTFDYLLVYQITKPEGYPDGSPYRFILASDFNEDAVVASLADGEEVDTTTTLASILGGAVSVL